MSRSLVSLQISRPSRKVRKAMTSRRWEKKMRKALSAELGEEIEAIKRPEKRMPHPPKRALVCDFCSSDNPQWDYPARDFVGEAHSNFVSSSDGDWAACSECHALIEAGDRSNLALRSLGLLLCKAPELTDHADEIYQELLALHQKFFTHRLGAAAPIK